MDLGLSGLRAMVTGGTRGIGRAIVDTFLAEGALVSFCARTPDEVQATEAALTANGGKAFGSTLDVASADGISAWVRESAEKLGGIDVIVSNVSALAIADTEENWAASFAVDLMGTVRLVNAALPYLQASSAASIVAVSSVSAREIDFAAGPYGTAKAALVHYIQGLANQLAEQGIRANTVSPGNTFFEGGVWDEIKQGDPELYSRALGLNPSGRMATPEETARTVVFVSSPASSRTSGANIVVDGALSRGVQL